MYSANGKKHDSISNEFCADWVADTKDGANFLGKGGMKAVNTIFENGGELVMSLCDDHCANHVGAGFRISSWCPVCRAQCSRFPPGAPQGKCRKLLEMEFPRARQTAWGARRS